MGDFVHLHTHTVFSPLDGIASPEEYFKICSERKYEALAITEHGNMASMPDAYEAARKYGIKYIPGCELYFNDNEEIRRNLVKDAAKKIRQIGDEERGRYFRHRHLTVLCQNMVGYRNLLKIKRLACIEGFYRKPRASVDMIQRHKDGIIVLSGCANGPIGYELQLYWEKKLANHDNRTCGVYMNNAVSMAQKFKEVLGDNFYIELQMPGIKNDVHIFASLINIAKDLKIKCVITNDAHYISADDYQLQLIMTAIDQDTTIDDPDLFISDSSSGYFKTREELRQTFLKSYKSNDVSLDDFEEACDNTLVIARMCETFKPDVRSKLPSIEGADDKLRQLVAEGLAKNGLDKDPRYVDRAEFELKRIIKKNFSSYFLICRDIVRQSTEVLGMPVGPRGSAGGSLVCFLIGIHEVDPIRFDLSFDRFLSSARGGKLLKVTMDNDELCQDDKQ